MADTTTKSPLDIARELDRDDLMILALVARANIPTIEFVKRPLGDRGLLANNGLASDLGKAVATAALDNDLI